MRVWSLGVAAAVRRQPRRGGVDVSRAGRVVAVGGDTWGLEAVPFEEGVGIFEIHQMLLAHNGIYILENMNTGPLAADGVGEFMFVLGQARIRGTVQMIINPVALY